MTSSVPTVRVYTGFVKEVPTVTSTRGDSSAAPRACRSRRCTERRTTSAHSSACRCMTADTSLNGTRSVTLPLAGCTRSEKACTALCRGLYGRPPGPTTWARLAAAVREFHASMRRCTPCVHAGMSPMPSSAASGRMFSCDMRPPCPRWP